MTKIYHGDEVVGEIHKNTDYNPVEKALVRGQSTYFLWKTDPIKFMILLSQTPRFILKMREDKSPDILSMEGATFQRMLLKMEMLYP